MNIYNIMPGDWVARKNTPQDKLKVFDSLGYRNMAHGEIRGFGATETAENLEPVPLTIEVFESNGFKVRCLYALKEFWTLEDGVDLDVVFRIEETHHHPYVLKGLDEDLVCVPVHYVHELQHYLKLFGIEKEIVL